MKNFKVGEWVIGPPLDYPIKITGIISTAVVEGMTPSGELGEFDIREEDVLATEEEIAEHMAYSVVDNLSEEDAVSALENNNDHFNASFDIATDTFYINGFKVYKQGEFIELL
jgi:tRNA A58 N-methylase Trm61